MPLPINIEDLINSRTVESVRIEFKRGWNPEEILHTVCAFSNDIKEYGGGYIIVGIETNEGQPVLPPYGVAQSQLDAIQKEFSEKICFQIKPNVSPIIEPIYFQNSWIIVIWITTGEERPYTAPSTLGEKGQRKTYIRSGSITRPATEKEIDQLRELSRFKHFDDRINNSASIADLDLGLILAYLQRIDSSLYQDAKSLPFDELCLKLQIARGPKENIRPLNIGLLLFSQQPEKFFEGCKTSVITISQDEKNHVSKTFPGPIHIQIEQILEYLKVALIKEARSKRGAIETSKFNNYPFQAIKEAIVNALYHRDYANPTPNEIRIYEDGPNRRIEILSYPGPMPPIDQEALLQEEIAARNYRNIRLGDWLKRLGLAEMYASGVPTMRRSMQANGSPRPELRTDDEKTIFVTTLKIHPEWPYPMTVEKPSALFSLTNLEQLILENCRIPQSYDEIRKNLRTMSKNSEIEGAIKKLVQQQFLSDKTVNKIWGLVKIRILLITPKGEDALQVSF